MRPNFAQELYSPFFDLGEPARDSPMLAHVPARAWIWLKGGAPRLQRSMTDSFRRSLHLIAGEPTSGFEPYELRGSSTQWDEFLRTIDTYPTASQACRARILGILEALCFQRFAFRLSQTEAEPDMNGDGGLELALELLMLRKHLGLLGNDWFEGLTKIVEVAPQDSLAGYSASMSLLVGTSKFGTGFSGIDELDRLRMLAFSRVEAVAATIADECDRAVLLSHFHRGASFVPFLHGNRHAATEELELALLLASGEGFVGCVSAREARYFANESLMRTKASVFDFDGAVSHAYACVILDPWDARAHFELAEFLVQSNRLEEAVAELRTARLLQPPGLGIIANLSAHAQSLLGQNTRSVQAALSSLLDAPDGLTPHDYVAGSGILGLESWSRSVADALANIGAH